jgi:hypothetical protein
MIHTLGTNSWRMIYDELPIPIDRYELLQYVSGTLNWITVYKDGNNNRCVVSFDLVNELYRKIVEPNYGAEDVKKVDFGCFEGLFVYHCA